VFVTALQADRAAEAVAGLKDLAREFRFRLGRMLRMRMVPELHFHYDDSVDRGEKIDTLLRSSGITDAVAAEREAEADAGGLDDVDGNDGNDGPDGRG
jgi:ribosome-binding factor A